MATNLTDALLSSKQTSAVMRPGVVVSWNPTRVQINVGGSTFDAAYLDNYNPPIPGDLVACIRQDSTWLVLGRFAGTGTNLVSNPSFEIGTVGSTPTSWTVQAWPNGPALATTWTIAQDPYSPDGGNVAREATNAAAQDVGLLSDYIPVNAGETYFLSAYVGTHSYTTQGGNYPNVELHAIWHAANPEAFVAATDSSMVANYVDVTETPPYRFLSGGALVPTGALFMRVGLRSITSAAVAAGATQWDYITCRRST